MLFKKTAGILAVSAAVLGMSACTTTSNYMHSEDAVMQVKDYSNMSSVDVITSEPQFSILAEAINQAGLGDALSDPNASYTIFAPTNDAFVSLLTEVGLTKQQLLSNSQLLQKVLAYHVVNAEAPIMSNDIKAGSVTTLGEQTFDFNEDGTIIDGKGRRADVIGPDMVTNTGVIHAVDTVMLPAQ